MTGGADGDERFVIAGPTMVHVENVRVPVPCATFGLPMSQEATACEAENRIGVARVLHSTSGHSLTSSAHCLPEALAPPIMKLLHDPAVSRPIAT